MRFHNIIIKDLQQHLVAKNEQKPQETRTTQTMKMKPLKQKGTHGDFAKLRYQTMAPLDHPTGQVKACKEAHHSQDL